MYFKVVVETIKISGYQRWICGLRVWRINHAESVLYVSGLSVPGKTGDVVQVCCTVYYTVLYCTVHTSPQERSSHEKLYKTSDIISHGYLPSRT